MSETFHNVDNTWPKNEKNKNKQKQKCRKITKLIRIVFLIWNACKRRNRKQ